VLYIHIPFCRRKCTYCAFYSAVSTGGFDSYVEALCAELRQRCGGLARPVETLYLGGGTPTVLSPAQLGRIASATADCCDLSRLKEATIEANPEDLTPQYLEALASLRIFNRLSIGVQSFSDEDLRCLNRRHSAAQARRAVDAAAAAGFANISIDLIYGLPGQSDEGWEANLAVAAALPITHLSAYALTVEEGTMLRRQIDSGRICPASEEQQIAHYRSLLRWAEIHGFSQYEISSFCRSGFRSLHNSRYWDRTPYLGIGAAAHSFDGRRRRWNASDFRRYTEGALAGSVPHEEEELTLRDAHNEYLMTALRTTDGIDKRRILPSFSVAFARRVRPFVEAGLLVETPAAYRPTSDGLLHADGIASDLFV